MDRPSRWLCFDLLFRISGSDRSRKVLRHRRKRRRLWESVFVVGIVIVIVSQFHGGVFLGDKEWPVGIWNPGEDDGIEKSVFRECNMSRCDDLSGLDIWEDDTVLRGAFVAEEAAFQCSGVDLVLRLMDSDICR
jgi:hypothetical protein